MLGTPRMLFTVWEDPVGRSALLSFGKERLGFPACWADVGTGSGCVCFSPLLPYHTDSNSVKWKFHWRCGFLSID